MGKHKKEHSVFRNKLTTGLAYIQELLDDMQNIPFSNPMRMEKACAIAIKLRVMLKDTRKDTSLLTHLSIRDKLLFSMDINGYPDIAANLMPVYRLISFQIDKEGNFYCIPNQAEISNGLCYSFDMWWNEIIIDTKGNDYSLVRRKDVVLTLAEKEGGGHEDSDYADDYYKVNYESGFIFIDENGYEQRIINNYYVESLIVIANEFIRAMQIYFKYIENRFKTITRTRFTMIRIQYPGNDTIYRFYPNAIENICNSIKIAYDYYREAQYDILVLKSYAYIETRSKITDRFLVLDDNEEARKLVYLRANDNDDIICEKVLLGKNNGYILINTDTDIFCNNDIHDLNYFINHFSNGDTSIFDEFLNRQKLK